MHVDGATCGNDTRRSSEPHKAWMSPLRRPQLTAWKNAELELGGPRGQSRCNILNVAPQDDTARGR